MMIFVKNNGVWSEKDLSRVSIFWLMGRFLIEFFFQNFFFNFHRLKILTNQTLSDVGNRKRKKSFDSNFQKFCFCFCVFFSKISLFFSMLKLFHKVNLKNSSRWKNFSKIFSRWFSCLNYFSCVNNIFEKLLSASIISLLKVYDLSF
jgi:hypothetical protein